MEKHQWMMTPAVAAIATFTTRGQQLPSVLLEADAPVHVQVQFVCSKEYHASSKCLYCEKCSIT